MTARLRPVAALLALALALLTVPSRAAQKTTSLPARLTDLEFWQLSSESSEPDGYFRSDNLTSNELGFLHVVPELVTRTKRGAVSAARRAHD